MEKLYKNLYFFMKPNKQVFSQNGMKYLGEEIPWKTTLFQVDGLMQEITLNLLIQLHIQQLFLPGDILNMEKQ